MANLDQPIGFRTWGPILRVSPYEMNSGAAVYINDLLNMESDGYPDAATAGETCIIGVSMEYRSASTAASTIYVPDDPDQLFVAQADESDLANVGYVGNHCDHLATTGSSTTGLSAHEINSSEVGTTPTGFMIKGKRPGVDNTWGANVDVIVQCYDHMFARGTAV